MPGAYARPPSVAQSWDRVQWQDYRDAVVGYYERTGDEAWWRNVGAACMKMADANLARLDASQRVSTALD